jgi:hypothetical protein
MIHSGAAKPAMSADKPARAGERTPPNTSPVPITSAIAVVMCARGTVQAPVYFRHEDSVNRGLHVLHTGAGFDSYLLEPMIPQ